MIAAMRRHLAVTMLALVPLAAAAQESSTIVIDDKATVRIDTTLGPIVVELNPARAPVTVQNFLQYVVEDHYDGTIFHRVATGFIVQGGGYLPDLTLKPAENKVFNESGNGLTNDRGTIAMARSNEAHSADSQFYFNLVDNNNLNPRPTRWGYAVFGEVIEGMDVVDQIGSVPTGPGGEFDRDVPIDPIIIEHIELIERE
jgi:peptidyl-prolyl cis-trans isomerase A (cyclophilin A)